MATAGGRGGGMWRALWWASASLMVSGSVLGGVAAAFLRRWPALPPMPTVLGVVLWAQLLLLVPLGVAAWRGRSGRESGWVVLRRLSVLPAVIVVVPAVWSWADVVNDLGLADPLRAPVLTSLGLTSVLAGLLILVFTGPKDADAANCVPRTGFRPGLTGVGMSALVIGVAVTAAVVLTRPGPEDSTTAAAGQPAPVPGTPRELKWMWQEPDPTWQVPDHLDRPAEVKPAGAGVVVAVDDGVIALDGVAGRERWHFRVTGVTRKDFAVSPGGGVVAITYPARDVEVDRVVVLDAMTGAVILDKVDGLIGFSTGYLELTDHMLVYFKRVEVEGKGFEITEAHGYDLRTGEHRWRYLLPAGCQTVGEGRSVGRDVVTVGLACHPDDPAEVIWPSIVTVVGLDERTGGQRWRFSRDNVQGGTLESSGDGSVVWVRWKSERDPFVEEGVMIDSATGAEVRNTLGENRPGLIDATPEWMAAWNRGDDFWLLAADSSESRSITMTGPVVDTGRVLGDPLATGESVMAIFGAVTSVEKSVVVQPWDGTPGRTIEIPLFQGEKLESEHVEYGMEAASGAVVVWSSGGTLVGLA